MNKLIIFILIAALLIPGAYLADATANAQGWQPAESRLTAGEAQQLAVQHADLEGENLTFSRTALDREDGQTVYQVEFRWSDWEYDYTIHADTGAIVAYDREYEPAAAPTQPAQTEPATEPPQPATEPTQPRQISAEDAKALALSHAGLSADQVTGLRAEFDWEDGRPVYEVEFTAGDWEYDYTIHAETGAVLKNHKEYEPPKNPTPPTTEPTQPATEPTQPVTEPTQPATEPATEPALISAGDAKALALSHAGLSADQVTGLRAEFDWEDGRPVYEVEFTADGWEYEYEIHAETGAILSRDKEWND